MKKYSDLIKYGLLVAFSVLLLSFASNSTVFATNGALSVSVVFDSPYLYEYNGNNYSSGNEENDVTVKYIIKNSSPEPVKLSAVRIVETLSGSVDSLYGNTMYDEGLTIAPDGELVLNGNLFSFDDSDDFVFQYDVCVIYTQQDEFGVDLPYTDDDFQSILSDNDMGIAYITREKISFDISYSYLNTDEDESIYPGDSVLLSAVLTSSSNVPIKNVKVYDSVYGLIGEVAVLQPNDPVTLSVDVVVRASTQSYPYLTYTSLDGVHIDERTDFEDSFINITVSKHSYNLGMEIQCDDVYIAKNQQVNVKFVVTNLGSGTIEDVNIVDAEGNVVFTIRSLGSGDICEESVTLKFSPNNTYVYKCISPLTEEVKAEISFLSLPGLNLSYTLNKDIIQYKYLDIVTVTYTVENKGSVDAKDLVISDCGQVYALGVLGKGEKRTFAMTYTLTSAETVFKPTLTGVYDDENSSEIEETGIETTIYVEMPAKYADIEFTHEIQPDQIHEGDTVTVIFTLKNNGTSPLTSYSVLIVEKNMIVASEGILQPGQTKTFSADVVVTSTQELTFKVSGKHGDEGNIYEKDANVKIIVIPSVVPTPIPTPTTSQGGATTAPTPSTPSQVIGGDDEEDNFQFLLMLVFAIGIVSVMMIIVTAVVVLKKTLGKNNASNTKRNTGKK